jgi:hypothetical protein
LLFSGDGCAQISSSRRKSEALHCVQFSIKFRAVVPHRISGARHWDRGRRGSINFRRLLYAIHQRGVIAGRSGSIWIWSTVRELMFGCGLRYPRLVRTSSTMVSSLDESAASYFGPKSGNSESGSRPYVLSRPASTGGVYKAMPNCRKRTADAKMDSTQNKQLANHSAPIGLTLIAEWLILRFLFRVVRNDISTNYGK